MADGFSVVAIIAAYNEADIIDAVVRDLIAQEISVYFIDDGSTDGTVEAVEPHVGRGVIDIERRSADRSAGRAFDWEAILCRKAELASTLDADWFIHHDADEIRESPWAGVPLKDAIRLVDERGYNAIDFESLDFRPTGDGFRAGDDVRAAFPFYSKAAPYDRVQIRCWKKTSPVDLTSSGGHEARFEDRRVFPIRFLLRHYPIRGQAHGERKVFVDRQPRFTDTERTRGWHVQYQQVAEGASFVQDPRTLTPFDGSRVRMELSLRHRGIEELEQSLDLARTGLDAARADLEERSAEIDRLRSELKQRTDDARSLCERLERRDAELNAARGDLAARTGELAARDAEIARLHAAATDLLNQLDAIRQSRAWRSTTPARVLYEWLARK